VERKPTEKDMEYLDKWTRRSAIPRGISDERLMEICNAERDGRCVVLPVKNGDKVYCLQSYFNDAKMRSEKKVKCRTVDFVQSVPDLFECNGVIYKFHDIGETVFLTREAAEAALKGDQHEQNL